MSRVLILGANSSIARAAAEKWAEKECHFFLVARNKKKLEIFSKNLKSVNTKVIAYAADLNDLGGHNSIINNAYSSLGGIDIVLICYGTLSGQEECEKSVDLTMNELLTNSLSKISLLTYIANIFEEEKQGTIAIVTSVSGDRGRASNYVYGSANAMVNTYTSGLRQRLDKSNISVITIKPGYVDTPMTKNHSKGILWASPAFVGKEIVSACNKKKTLIYNKPS